MKVSEFRISLEFAPRIYEWRTFEDRPAMLRERMGSVHVEVGLPEAPSLREVLGQESWVVYAGGVNNLVYDIESPTSAMKFVSDLPDEIPEFALHIHKH